MVAPVGRQRLDPFQIRDLLRLDILGYGGGKANFMVGINNNQTPHVLRPNQSRLVQPLLDGVVT